MATTTVPAGEFAAAGAAHAHEMSFVRKYIFSTDHKIIGIQFLIMSLVFLLVGGLLAMVIRWQLGFPGRSMPGGGVLPDT
ncbi:MAG: cytochrome C oxidase subunit I, partial [Gemmatimonadaceae bacterium]